MVIPSKIPSISPVDFFLQEGICASSHEGIALGNGLLLEGILIPISAFSIHFQDNAALYGFGDEHNDESDQDFSKFVAAVKENPTCPKFLHKGAHRISTQVYGDELIQWIVDQQFAATRTQGLELCQQLTKRGMFCKKAKTIGTEFQDWHKQYVVRVLIGSHC